MDDNIKLFNNIKEIRSFVNDCKTSGKKVGFVPTMGALHEGHLTLVKEAQKLCDIVIISIYVNPAQFAPNEDFNSYPRQLKDDCDKLASINADAVYAPDNKEMYPSGFSTNISVSGITDNLCGASRPTHFDGVALIVTKLLLQVNPDMAFFGEKDFQQLQVIKCFVSDLNIETIIQGVNIVRDKETGLALSSRNAYLSGKEIKIANNLNKILFSMSDEIQNGENIDGIIKYGYNKIINAGFDNIDYLEVCTSNNLMPVKNKKDRELRILVAAKIGKIRLIDNVSA